MCGFLVILAVATAIFQAIQGLLVLRIEGRISAHADPGGLGSPAPAPEPVLRRVLLGRPGAAGDGAQRGLQEGLRGGRDQHRDGRLLALQPGACSTTIAGGWRCARRCCWALLLLVTTLLLAGRLRLRDRRSGGSTGSISGLLLELFGGIITLRSAGAESRALARWAAPLRRTAPAPDPLPAVLQRASISGWRSIPILTAMVVYTGAVHVDPG